MRASGSTLIGVLLASLLLATAMAGCTVDNKTTANDSGDGGGDPYDEEPPVEHAPIKGLTHLFAEDPAPDFEATTIDGETFRLSDHKGKVVLIEFMGAGCGSCLKNLPDHKKLYADFEDNESFQFVAIDVWGRETEEDLREYRDKHGIEWPMALDPGGVEDDYDVAGTPTQYLIDHEGQAHSRGNVLSYASMHEEVSYLLAQAAA